VPRPKFPLPGRYSSDGYREIVVIALAPDAC